MLITLLQNPSYFERLRNFQYGGKKITFYFNKGVLIHHCWMLDEYMYVDRNHGLMKVSTIDNS